MWRFQAYSTPTFLVPADSRTGWRRFCRYFSEQSRLFDEGAELDILQNVLEGCPNSKYVELLDLESEVPWRLQMSFYDRIAQETLLPDYFAFSTTNDVHFEPTKSAHVALLKALEGSSKVEALYLANLSWVSVNTIEFSGFYRTIRPCLSSLFSKLRYLRL